MLQYTLINTTISELLFKHDCVILPNFGGFVARHYTSSFSKGNNVLFPPSKHILFNKNLIHNDGLLLSALMEKMGILYNEASKELENYTDYIQSLLNVKKRFELPHIGLLYIDAENNLRFEAKADVNFLLDSFGFEPVIANELVSEPEKAIKAFEDRKAITLPLEKQRRSYVKVAALSLIAPATLAFLLFAAYSKPMKPLLESSLNPFYTPEKTYISHKIVTRKSCFIGDIEKQPLLADANGYASFRLSDNGNTLVATVNDNAVKADKTYVHTSLSKSKSKLSFDGKFQIVVGCFGIEENADKLVKELEKKHIYAGVSGINAKGLHVVSCGSFNTKEEAVRLLSQVKGNLPSAWIMAK